MAEISARELASFVDDSYRQSSTCMRVSGRTINVPYRFHFLNSGKGNGVSNCASPAAQCLLTRSTDGYLRQKSLNAILGLREPWIAPFVVALIGEYVVEIIDDIQASLPSLSQEIYSNFVRENRDVMRIIKSKAASYWDVYYRHEFPDRASYPGFTVLRQLDEWAS
jgi:hypothetical protein